MKKVLYKENPKAVFQYIVDGNIYYQTKIGKGMWAYHKVPMEDTKGATFEKEMDSKHLIKWLMEGLKIEV